MGKEQLAGVVYEKAFLGLEFDGPDFLVLTLVSGLTPKVGVSPRHATVVGCIAVAEVSVGVHC